MPLSSDSKPSITDKPGKPDKTNMPDNPDKTNHGTELVPEPSKTNHGGRVSCDFSEPLSYFDVMIADAIYTLESYRVRTIYARNIAAVLSGDPDIVLKPARKKELEDAIDRMSLVSISIRYDPYDGFCYTKEERSGCLSGPFLPLETNRSGGFTWAEKPPLSRYAEIMNGEFFVIPESLLCVRGGKGGDGAKMQTSRENRREEYELRDA
ncbi:MAG: hypothetical protein ACOYJO_02010 [Eubacterium sp.]|jgi:hypothetical protein